MKYIALSAATLAALPYVAAQSPVYGQCGGIGWTGSTTCVSGSTCTYSNDYYSQCLPGGSGGGGTTTASTTTRTTSTSATATATGNPSGSPGLGFLGGVNTAGYDFTVYTDGSFSGTGVPPPTSQYSHFSSQGAKIFRIPFAWQLMTPSVGGTISSSFFSQYDSTVQAALSTGAYVIIDLHNYARWNGAIIGQGGPTNDQYASIWSQLAAKYKGNSKIIFGIMNEPHDIPNLQSWATSVQAAVNAIRSAGASSQFILIPGSSYSSAQQLPTEAGPYLLKVTDPAGGNKLLFDVHKYLDSDNSGTHTECVTDNVSVMQNLNSWLKQNNRYAILSETGGGNTQSCFNYLKSELAYVKSSGNIIGFTAWSAGSFDNTYELVLTPNSNGSDQPLWTNAIKPNL